MPNLDFAPDAERARVLDRAMLAALGDSLEHIGESAAGHLRFDRERLRALVDALRSGVRHPPGTFGRYYDLVERIAADDLGGAQAMLDAVLASRPVPHGLRAIALSDPSLRPVAELYRRRMDTDPRTRFEFLDPPDELVAPFADRLDGAMALFDGALPELSGEVRGLLSEIVLAAGPTGASYVFDGGSSYMLWGAMFLNVQFHQTRVEMAEVIAHESAHTFLFGMSVDEPLVFNADEELYPSPLRVDPRPMNGIYHATFVSARMHWVMSQLADSDLLDASEKAAARNAAAADRANFLAGWDTVSRHARMSANGAGLMEAAAASMRLSR